jgi:hypothetical protein
MKKFTIFLTLFYLMITVCNSQIDWSEILDQPHCYDNIEEWTGPLERTICADDFIEIECSDCCYTIVYNDRWIFIEDLESENYELYILGIFYEGDNCENCDKNLILDVFYKDLMYEKAANEPNFIDRITGNSIQGFNMFYYTPAKCLDIYSSICNSQEVCCIYAYDWLFQRDEYNEIYLANIGEDTFYDGSYSCNPPENCNIHCDYPYQSLFPVGCFFPNNTEGWGNEYDLDPPIDLGSICPGCSVVVSVRDRGSVANDDFDTEITNIDLIGNCNNCDIDDIMSYVIDYILKYHLDPGVLQQGFCITNRRIVIKSCWQAYSNSYVPCSKSECCWAVYKVCNEDGEIPYEYYLIETGPGENVENCDPTQPCQMVCGSFPNP